MRETVSSTKDLPIREIDRESFKKRKEKHQEEMHEGAEGKAAEKPEEEQSISEETSKVGKDVLEKVLREKYEEKLMEKTKPKLPAEEVEGTKLERVPDRDVELEKKLISMTEDGQPRIKEQAAPEIRESKEPEALPLQEEILHEVPLMIESVP